jgi:hypothetical protein
MDIPINLFKNDSNSKTTTLFETDENEREIKLYKINNSQPSGTNLYYPNVLLKPYNHNNYILPILERTMSLQAVSTIYEKNGMQFLYEPRETKPIYTEPVFFFIYNTDNYFHFLYDTLPYLISFLHLRKTIPTLKLLMQYPNEQKTTFYPFVIEFLEILNITKNDIVIIIVVTLIF